MERRAKVGVFGIGLEAYWDQFGGLKERLEGYQRSVAERISQWRRWSPRLTKRGPPYSPTLAVQVCSPLLAYNWGAWLLLNPHYVLDVCEPFPCHLQKRIQDHGRVIATPDHS